VAVARFCQWFADEQETADPDAADKIASQMDFYFVRKVAEVVALLHERGKALGPDGRIVPIIVHELEYQEELALQNERANPNAVSPDDFLRFCRCG